MNALRCVQSFLFAELNIHSYSSIVCDLSQWLG